MSVRVGLDMTNEKIFVELGEEGGLKTTVSLTALTARALAAQIVANAEALDVAMEEGQLGNDDDG